MGRVKVNDLQPSSEATRRAVLWGLIKKLNLAVNRLFEAGKGYALIVNDDKVESFITSNVKEAFATESFEIIVPPELQSKRTLVLTGVDSYILSFSENELKEAIMQSKPNLKVIKVIKLPDNVPVMKVQLETIQMVQDSITSGIVVNGQSFSNNNLSQDIFVHIPQCMRCYSYDHVRKDCPESDNYTICSNCSSKDHRYTNCHNAFKKCITCSQDHPTMAARCARRKNIIKNTAKGIRSQSKARPANFAQAATVITSNSAPQLAIPQHTPWPGTPSKHTTVIHAAIIYANLREMIQPGTFQETFTKILTKNGLPNVLIPDDVLIPHEMAKLGLSPTTPQEDPNNSTVEEMVDVHEYDNRKRTHEHDSDSDSVSNSTNKVQRSDAVTPPPQETEVQQQTSKTDDYFDKNTHARSLGLKLYAPNTFNVPKKLTNHQLIGFIRSKQLKYHFTANHNEQTLHNSIMKGDVILTNIPIQPIAPTRFKSIRQGYFNLSASKSGSHN